MSGLIPFKGLRTVKPASKKPSKKISIFQSLLNKWTSKRRLLDSRKLLEELTTDPIDLKGPEEDHKIRSQQITSIYNSKINELNKTAQAGNTIMDQATYNKQFEQYQREHQEALRKLESLKNQTFGIQGTLFKSGGKFKRI